MPYFSFDFVGGGRLAAFVGLLTVCVGCSGPASENSLPPPAPPKQITAPESQPVVFVVGDRLELFVKEDATLNGSYEVREGGYIVIPRVGRIQIAGLSRSAAENAVKSALQKSQLTEATVIAERIAGQQSVGVGVVGVAPNMQRILVYITGRVAKAGGHMVPVPPNRALGVYEALLITGGVSKFSRLDKVEVIRTDADGKRHRAILNLQAVADGEADDHPVQEGDIIHVPEKVFGF
jgi:protein involved in polysaccharide export with SLBB domain